MIDLHCHILPSVDDGADHLDQAVQMCIMAAEDGCTAMVATPHLRHERWWNGDRDGLEKTWRELQERVRERVGERIEIYLGGEIAVHLASLNEMLDELPGGSLLTMAGSHYLLLEFDFQGLGPDPESLIYELCLRGWRPIIAHPERIGWLTEDKALMGTLVELGASVQVTAMALTGGMGRRARDAGYRLMEDGWVHFVASDAHDVRIRPPGLSEARRLVGETWGEAKAKELFELNPLCVLKNEPLASAEAAQTETPEERFLRA